MRWRFPHPSETPEREDALQRIDAWWRSFAAAAPQLDDFFRRRDAQDDAQDLARWMREHLGGIDERITWELGPGTRGGDSHRLVLTPEGKHRLRPLVEAVLARAPGLVGWEFHAHRLAEVLPTALQTVVERTSVDLTGWRAHAEMSEDGLVDVTLAPPARVSPSAESRKAALLLVEVLVGEDLMDVWIGDVDVREGTNTLMPLGELAACVRALVETWRARIPPLPYFKRSSDASWMLLRLAPKTNAAPDYPGQQDMLVARTLDFAMWRSQHGRRPFHSRRFSRSGETMCTLKMDGTEGLSPSGLADKSAIEDAITSALEPRGLGGQIGGGTGLRYSYVDLALTDVGAAMEALRPVLRAGNLPKRTWLQFFDADLADEWIPLWDDGPPPPR